MLLVVAVLPMMGLGGFQVYKAETPGPMKDAKFTPRIAETARGLWGVYFVFSAACMLAYSWAGMSWVDAFMHMCTTMGLGGFSSYDASIGHFDSPPVERVAIVFMALAGINFAALFHRVAQPLGPPAGARPRDPHLRRCAAGLDRGAHRAAAGAWCLPDVLGRCASAPSTWSRWPPPPATPPPTTRCGRCSRRCCCCFWAALFPALVPPAAASRWSA